MFQSMGSQKCLSLWDHRNVSVHGISVDATTDMSQSMRSQKCLSSWDLSLRCFGQWELWGVLQWDRSDVSSMDRTAKMFQTMGWDRSDV